MRGKDENIPEALLAAVYAHVAAHAAAGRPEEVCGLLVGPRAGGLEALDEIRRCDNQQDALHAADPATFPRDARTAYTLGARDLLYVGRSLDGPRPVRVIYHSHVDVGAYFSDEDQRGAVLDGEPAYAGVDYLVVDAASAPAPGAVRGAKLFRFARAAGRFVEVAVYGAPKGRDGDGGEGGGAGADG